MMLNCRESTRLMSEEQDRKLTTRERMALRFHNLMCSGCTNYRKHMGFIRCATRALREGRGE